MEIKEAVKEIREGDMKTTSPQRGVAILTICQALCDGYTLCKVDEAIQRTKQLAWKESSIELEDCVEILKEACL